MMIKYLSVVALIVFLFTFANCENWSVNVGDAGKKVFEPPNFDANVGDTVSIQFNKKKNNIYIIIIMLITK
jgi:plastocyanin